MMDTIRTIHEHWADTAIGINLLAGIFTLVFMGKPRIRNHKYFYFPIYAGWIALLIQVFLGIYLFSEGTYSADPQHYFYGFIALIAIGFFFAYLRSMGKKKPLILGILAIFFAAMSVRAIMAVPASIF